MNEMIERVTKAIEKCRIDCYGTDEDIAIAAISAMREPTEDMVDSTHLYMMASKIVREYWKKMIDEALK